MNKNNQFKYVSIYLYISFLFILPSVIGLVEKSQVLAVELKLSEITGRSPLGEDLQTIATKAQDSTKKKEERRKETSAKLQLAKNYLRSGNLPEAISLLQEIITLVKTSSNYPLEYTARLYLGNAYLLQGDYARAISTYLASGELVSNLPDNTEPIAVLNNLSLAYYRQAQDLFVSAQKSADYDEQIQQKEQQQAEKSRESARQYAQQAVEIAAVAPYSLSSVRAWLNWQKISGISSPSDYGQQLEILLSLPPSSNKARLLVAMADYTTTEKIVTLKKAVSTAQKIDDYRTLSWAWGTLGALAENQGLFSAALKHTQKAQLAAQKVLAIDIMYRWQWQLGRIYTALGKTELAQFRYNEAISSIQLIKDDLLLGIRRKQINYSEEIEPIYRQYLKLLFKEEQSLIPKAWAVAEMLSQSELESYFGDNCFVELEQKQKPNDVAVIRSLIFNETTYLMLKLPSEEIKVFPLKIASKDLNNLIKQWRYKLEFPIDNTYRIIGQQLYELLMQPIEHNLAQINHLVFINDGLLRTVPMAALYNGKKHLIEQYSISYAFSSDLEISKEQNKNNLLAFGLSNSLNRVDSLPAVKQELVAIEQVLNPSIKGTFLLNEDFTLTNLETEMFKEYSWLHLATHSSFGGSLDNTYIQVYDQVIPLKKLEQILIKDEFSLQLLFLSSCETALGDKDALLGLAGIGTRTGVQATIGSVWAVNSASTVDLVVNFYDYYVQENIPSAEALKQAQLKLINKQLHPYYWSGFINIY